MSCGRSSCSLSPRPARGWSLPPLPQPLPHARLGVHPHASCQPSSSRPWALRHSFLTRHLPEPMALGLQHLGATVGCGGSLDCSQVILLRTIPCSPASGPLCVSALLAWAQGPQSLPGLAIRDRLALPCCAGLDLLSPGHALPGFGGSVGADGGCPFTCCSRAVLHSCHIWVASRGSCHPQPQRGNGSLSQGPQGPLPSRLKGIGRPLLREGPQAP